MIRRPSGTEWKFVATRLEMKISRIKTVYQELRLEAVAEMPAEYSRASGCV